MIGKSPSLLSGRGGRLRATKPKGGEETYVWRLIAFSLSPRPSHMCIPTTHDFGMWDQYPDWDERTARTKELDKVVAAIVNTVPLTQQPGTMRWARAFGV